MNISQRTKIILIVIAVLVALGALVIIMMQFPRGGEPQEPKDTGFTDTNSGEVVSDPEGKAPETYRDQFAELDTIKYLGTIELVNNGMSNEQLENTKLAFKLYSDKRPIPIEWVSVIRDSIKTTTLRDSGASRRPSISFDVEIDRKEKFKAVLEYVEISSVQLYLSDTSGALVFDSGIVDTPYGTD